MKLSEQLFSKNAVLIYFFGVIALLVLIFFLWQPYSRAPISNADDPRFSPYISEHTAGVISKNSTIRIQLTPETSTLQDIGKEDSRKLITLYPEVSGKTFWLDANTIEFIPDQPLKPSTHYSGSFSLGKITNVPPDLMDFNFEFQVVKPSFEVNLHGFKSQDPHNTEFMQYTGSLYFSDEESSESIEKLLAIKLDNQTFTASWLHDPGSRTSSFTIDSLEKTSEERKLTLTFEGKHIGSTIKEKKNFILPRLGDFTILDIKAVQAPEQFVLVQFSDPIRIGQHLEGLIEIEQVPNVITSIQGSEIKLFAADRLEDNFTVQVHPGIESITQQKLVDGKAANVFFENRMPAVSIPGKGTILPGTGKLTVPFEAVNLRAVDVTIVKIYEDNIPQYFQRSYHGNEELRRVATPIVQTTIALDRDKALDLHRKNRFSLDIDKFVKTEPGAIYRVLIGFRQSYSLYPCDEFSSMEDPDREDYYYRQNIDNQDEFWSRYNSYYPIDYDWNERDNPCHSSFYTADRWVSRDMMASNIGLLAKKENSGDLLVYATDIVNALPLPGVSIEVLDYQQRIIQVGISNSEGMLRLERPERPFMLIARKDRERAYLKLDDGSSLPLSRFDVGGDVVQHGIKGFIYTERGVWRPGDSLYVGFILEETSASLPKGHPVTFELIDPQGRLHTKSVQNEGLNGFYIFETVTTSGAPTGNWRAKIQVGGAVFERTLKIETVMPNRLKVDLDFSGLSTLTRELPTSIKMQGNWLFGAPASRLNARVEVSLSSSQTAFTGYEAYHFTDPTREYSTESQMLFDGTLDENGVANISKSLSVPRLAPGMLRAHFTTRIFEPGGNFSVDYRSIPFSPFSRYIGVQTPEGDNLSGMLLTDENHEISIALVDHFGKPIPGEKDVQVELYKIRWNWWWNQESDYFGNFTQDQHNQLLQKETIHVRNGKGTWDLRINYPEWGRYLIRIIDADGGHSTGKVLYIDWPGWAKREQLSNPSEASMLSFTSDKERYSVGETATLTIPTVASGRALISIENGREVMSSEWIETQAGQTSYSLKITPEMAPNAYVNISLIQPHAQTLNDLPIRMYGVIPILVDDPQTILQPSIELKQVLRPESESSITIKESSGKPMTYTVAIVDEGLLSLTGFATPDPHRNFFAREALGVKSWDVFDQVVGAWSGELERLLSIGGDADATRNVHPAKANRFESVVRFLGPFHLKQGRSNTHSFSLPAYVGAVRAMVIAGNDGAYGFAEQEAQVRTPLMLLASLPRVIGPKETFRVPVTVFAMEKGLKQVDVRITSDADHLTVASPTQTLHFEGETEQLTYFEVHVSEQTGLGKLRITATSGSHHAKQEIELDIRNPNPFVTQIENHRLEAKQRWTETFDTSPTSGNEHVTVEISTLPPINLQKHLNYLIRYPHGGLEQVVSAVFPQLYLDKLTVLSENKTLDIQRNVNAGIQRLRGHIRPDGGFAYWPGAKEAHEWSTNYAGHFLLEAKQAGYTVPDDVLRRWTMFQQNKARQWTANQYNWRGGDLMQAYRLYTLALAGNSEVGAMNRLKEFSYLSDEAAWRLATAYQLIGQESVALQLIKNRKLESSEYAKPGYTFGSSLRDQAMMLESLSVLKLERDAEQLIPTIAAKLQQNNRHSTQSIAYALLSIGKYMNVMQKSLHFRYSLDGTTKEVRQTSYLYQIEIPMQKNKPSLMVENQSSGTLHVRVIKDGQLAIGEQPMIIDHSSFLKMNVQYKNNLGESISPANLIQGTDFIAEVTIQNTGDIGTIEQVALTQIFPAGWEIINSRVSGQAGELPSSPAIFTDVRDDRVLTYFNIRQDETLTYRVRLNAAYTGSYHLPSISVEAMYDHRAIAIVPGNHVRVIPLEQ